MSQRLSPWNSRSIRLLSPLSCCTPPGPGGATSLGSGFVVNLNGRLFLVTAEHVSKTVAGQVAVTYGDKEDHAATTKLADLVRRKPGTWVTHGNADVAALELRSEHPAPDLLLARALPSHV